MANRPQQAVELKLVTPQDSPVGEDARTMLAAPDARDTLVHAVGTRPDFIKMATVVAALEQRGAFRQVVVHTGEHQHPSLSGEVMADVGFPGPDHFLGITPGSHAVQTANVLAAFERVLLEERPSLVVVAGDGNSGLACALAAVKLGIPVAHVEAGLRSWDWSAPEEINRVLTDRLADTLFTHSPEAGTNLAAEGIPDGRVHCVGSTTIDALRRCEQRARTRAAWRRFGLVEGGYVLVTMHRPANVDEPSRLAAIVEALGALAIRTPVLFPVHPRTRSRLAPSGGLDALRAAGVLAVEPMRYLDFLSLQAGAGAIVTDSGGVQEEASALGVACYTLRPATERPVTLTHGTNVLLGDDPAEMANVRPSPGSPTPSAIPMWDGRAGERVADALVANYALSRAAVDA